MAKGDTNGNEANDLLRPAPLLMRFAPLLLAASRFGPVLDLACGRGDNGLYLATLGAKAVLADADGERLEHARVRAAGLDAATWLVDLEAGANPLPVAEYGGIVVFRYLHRPLLSAIAAALAPGGVLVYETFTTAQARYGKPTNPAYLLGPGELAASFRELEVLHSWEGELRGPQRAVAQLVARKPANTKQP